MANPSALTVYRVCNVFEGRILISLKPRPDELG